MSERQPAVGGRRGLLIPAAIVSGVGSYVFLALAARVLDPAGYAELSVVWSFVVVVALGVLLPVEQELTRQAIAGSSPAALRSAMPTGLGVLALAEAGWLGLAIVVGLPAPMAVAGALVLPVLVLQSGARGLLAGAGAFGRYAALVAIEGGVRALLPLALLLLAGVLAPGPAALVVVVVAAGILSLLPALGAAPLRLGAGAPPQGNSAPLSARRFAARTAGLSWAALAVQLVLNGAVLAAALLPGDPEASGRMLAVVSLARIPVFLYQSLQAAVLPPISAARHRGRAAEVRRRVAALLAVAAAVAVAVSLVGGLAGRQIVALVFGPDVVLGADATALLSAGLAAAFVAIVASDCLAALGRHAVLGPVWTVAVAIGVGTLLLTADAGPRSVAVAVLATALFALLVLVGVLLPRLLPGPRR